MCSDNISSFRSSASFVKWIKGIYEKICWYSLKYGIKKGFISVPPYQHIYLYLFSTILGGFNWGDNEVILNRSFIYHIFQSINLSLKFLNISPPLDSLSLSLSLSVHLFISLFSSSQSGFQPFSLFINTTKYKLDAGSTLLTGVEKAVKEEYCVYLCMLLRIYLFEESFV